ncbi:MAG: radical SAM protein [Desulfurococcus sp.]|nr:radical SAM protein [Desulfurococcus sp.]
MRILVVDALARSTGRRYSTFDAVGAGPRVIAGMLQERYDSMLLPYERVMADKSILAGFDYVFVSVMSSDIGALWKLVKRAKSANPSVKITVGGPASFEYSRLLDISGVDYVIVGEAEIPLKQFMECVMEDKCSARSVPALAFKDSGVAYLTSSHVHTPRDVLSSVKPWVMVDKSLEHPQIYRIYVEVVRGCSNYSRPMVRSYGLNCIFCGNCRSTDNLKRLECPANIPPGCGFCSVPSMFGPARSRSISSIVEEIEELLEHGARRIVLSAPDFLDYGRDLLVKEPLTNPCNPPANVEAIEDLLSSLQGLKKVSEGRAVVMIENIKACLVSEEVAEVLGRYLKDTTVHIGLETGNDVYNSRVLGKPISVAHVLNAVRLLRRHGLRPYVYLMHSLPLASRKVYEDTIKVVGELEESGVEKVTLYKYTPLPHTAFSGIPPSTRGVEEYIERLKEVVARLNRRTKEKMLGAHIEAYIMLSEGRLYGYPVRHGPVVFLGPARRPGLNGCLAVVEVIGTGERYVKGKIVRIKECP